MDLDSNAEHTRRLERLIGSLRAEISRLRSRG